MNIIKEFFSSQLLIFSLIISNFLTILFFYIIPITMTVLLYIHKKRLAWLSILPPSIITFVFLIWLGVGHFVLSWKTIIDIICTLLVVCIHFGILISIAILFMFLINKIIKKNCRK